MTQKKAYRCSNGHLELSGVEPVGPCPECGDTDWELQLASWPVITKRGNLTKRMGSTITVHNKENPCNNTPDRVGATDLDTANATLDVKLCKRCSWPDGAESFVAEN